MIAAFDFGAPERLWLLLLLLPLIWLVHRLNQDRRWACDFGVSSTNGVRWAWLQVAAILLMLFCLQPQLGEQTIEVPRKSRQWWLFWMYRLQCWPLMLHHQEWSLLSES